MPHEMRATYTCWWWPSSEPDSDHWTWGGYCDPSNPYGTLDKEPREQYHVEGDEPIVESFDDRDEAVKFIVDFPGGVWDLAEGEPEQDYRTGVYYEVTLHVDDVDLLNEAGAILEARRAERRRRLESSHIP